MIQGIKNVYRAAASLHPRYSSSSSSSSSNTLGSIKAEWRKRRNAIFNKELERQRGEVGRIEKICVRFQPRDKEAKEVEMMMNQNISTPYDCAKHMSETVHTTSALALVDDEPYDIHRPFTRDCQLKILTMKMPGDSNSLNTAFWRTCSLIMGAMIDNAFKDDMQLYLHSFPRPNIRSGSFIYDVVLDLPEWHPTDSELRAMSALFVKITNDALPVERLEVSEEMALDMFQDNPFKSKQIPEIAKLNDDQVVLYRIGEHVEVSKGPMVGNTGIIGRATIAAVHKIESEETDRMYRFQGVAIPRGVFLNHVAYGIVEKKAKRLNTTMWTPQTLPVQDVKEIKEALIAQN